MTTENSKDNHRKGFTTSLQIIRPQVFSGQKHKMQKDCPIHKPAPMSIQSWGALIKKGTSGSQKDSL